MEVTESFLSEAFVQSGGQITKKDESLDSSEVMEQAAYTVFCLIAINFCLINAFIMDRIWSETPFHYNQESKVIMREKQLITLSHF